jgi:geranylgeranyl diphosphate synthase type 3
MDNILYLTPVDELLTQPVKYYKEIKGKDTRKAICNILGMYLGVEKKDIDNIDQIISIIHNASLVIDDIQDNSVLRRNRLCAHLKYGVGMAINAGYLTIFKILTEVNKNNEITEKLKHKIVENIYYTHIGQGMDIYYTQNKIIPTIEEYNTMMEYKTGMLFISIIDLLFEKTKNVIVKKNYNNLLRCVVKFAIFFQIRDDYINLTDIKYWKEKGFCQDFDEQKISYLITYCVNNKMENYETINLLLNKRDKTNGDKIQLLMIMYNNGLLDIIYNKLVELKNEVLELLNYLDIIFEQLPFHNFEVKYVKDFFTNIYTDEDLNNYALRACTNSNV